MMPWYMYQAECMMQMLNHSLYVKHSVENMQTIIYVYVVGNILSQVIFFLMGVEFECIANEVKTKEKYKLPEIKK